MPSNHASGPYDFKVRETLRGLRGDISTTVFARELSSVLRRTVSRTQVTRWESGAHTPGADVFLAAMAVSKTPREELPTPVGQDARRGALVMDSTRLDTLELKVESLRDFQDRLERALKSI